MSATSSIRYITVLATIFILHSSSIIQAQEKKQLVPELTVAGLKLGDRESGKAFLHLYQPRTDEDNVPKYYFYNGQGTTVMKVTAASIEDPFFVTEIEVFRVSEAYQKRHFFLKDTGHFVTESGIFIGLRQKAGNLALAMLVGVPNIGRSNIIGPNDVIRRKGEPDDRETKDKEETFDYRIENIQVGGADHKYSAFYRFYKRELKQFIFRIEPRSKLEIAKSAQ